MCGSQKLRDFLINKSRAFIYTTAVSPAICAAALKSLEIVKNSDKKRQHLHTISALLKNKLTNLDFNTANSKSQIIPIITGSIENTEKLSLNQFKMVYLYPCNKTSHSA